MRTQITVLLAGAFSFLSFSVLTASANDPFRDLAIQTGRNAANAGTVMGAEVVLSARQCNQGYATMPITDLSRGGCFAGASPFSQCVSKLPSWTAIQDNTDRHCLTIWKAMTLNSQGEDFQYSRGLTFRQMQAHYAYHLSRNSLFMNTLDGLDQAQIQKLASYVTKPIK